MLRTNLSTRPFYNERGVHALLAGAAVLVIALTIFNVFEIVMLSRKQSALGSSAASAENRARELRAQAAAARQRLDSKQLEAISGAADEANAIIGQRLFSWTDLLNRLETTLPDEVRIASMRPRVEHDNTVMVQIAVTGRRAEDISQFINNLEGTGAFAQMLTRDQTTNEEGLLQAVIDGRYLPESGATPKGMR